MLAFLKKWRKAYLDDKGDRLYAQAELDRNVLCQNSASMNDIANLFDKKIHRKKNIDFDEIHREAVKIFPSSDEHRTMW
ncbi:TPA: hypothetical protein KDY96_003996 [Vibrio parahaemolyticus]|nr:hypothetical protein [Vibrio parahaemolyticus]